MKAKLKLTAVFQEAEEGGYIAFIEELPGVNTQGDTLDEAKTNLLEAMYIVMDTRRMLSAEELKNTRFIKEQFDLAS
jgi:predicted RNase H-like HicB family nuclease